MSTIFLKEILLNAFRLKLDGLNLNPKVAKLISSCLIKDPFQRITLEEIMV